MILSGATPTLAALIGEPLERIFDAVPGEVPVPAVVPALFGLPPSVVGDLGALLMGRSAEAALILATTPRLLRNMAQGTSVELERCVHEVRGQVSWSETLQAWGNTFGDTDVYICRTPRRDRDLAENRVLAFALLCISRAAFSLDSEAAREFHPRTLEEVAENAATARMFLNHPMLAGVSKSLPSAAERRKTRQSKRAPDYAPSLAMADLRRQPFHPKAMGALCDWRTAAQHEVLAYLIARLGPNALAGLRASDERVRSRHLEYRHWSTSDSGIVVGDLLLDVPSGPSADGWGRALADLERRADGRRTRLVTNAVDLEMAVDALVERPRRVSADER